MCQVLWKHQGKHLLGTHSVPGTIVGLQRPPKMPAEEGAKGQQSEAFWERAPHTSSGSSDRVV